MEDLGRALASGRDTLMLGGGNPAHIPALEALFRAEHRRKLSEAPARFARVFGDYSPRKARAGSSRPWRGCCGMNTAGTSAPRTSSSPPAAS